MHDPMETMKDAMVLSMRSSTDKAMDDATASVMYEPVDDTTDDAM